MDIKDRLRRHPDYTRITIAGEEREFFLGPHAYTLAEERGVDALTMEGHRAAVAQLYAGCLPFAGDDFPDFADFCTLVSAQEMGRAVRLLRFPEAEGNGHAGGAGGKAPGRKAGAAR